MCDQSGKAGEATSSAACTERVKRHRLKRIIKNHTACRPRDEEMIVNMKGGVSGAEQSTACSGCLQRPCNTLFRNVTVAAQASAAVSSRYVSGRDSLQNACGALA